MTPIHALAALCLLMLTACSFKTEWRDTTGQGRGADQAKADLASCMPSDGLPDRGDPDLAEKMKAASEVIAECMTGKGWKLVRARIA
jgi:hypothetical protein